MWTLYDVLATPGEAVEALARRESRLLGAIRIFRAGEQARFHAGERSFDARTGPGGYASVAMPSLPPGRHPIRVEDTEAGAGAIWIVPPDRPLIVTDLDRTVSQPTAIGFWLRGLESIRPFDGAREALSRAAERSLVVYLTARSDLLMGKTRAWLRLGGFPPGPVFCRHRRAPGPTSGEFKRETVARLKLRWPRIELGIGDKELDVRAYVSNGVPAAHFQPSGSAAAGRPGVSVCSSWEEIARLLEGGQGG
jgi:hypothetical protein